MTAWHVGLLRAVNLAGRNTVRMDALAGLLAELDLQAPRTLLQSGNVVFQSDARSTSALEARIEEAAARRLGVKTELFVRTAREWQAVITDNPFRAEAARDPGHLLVMLLKDAPGRDRVAALQGAIAGREVVRAGRRHIYVVYPDGVGQSRLTTAVIERALGTRTTGRNWNTVMKLGALVR